jgi:O-glycosyl hydrolase
VAGVEQVAFENPDRSNVLVVTNAGPARTLTVTQQNRSAELALEADSVTTLLWS